MFEITKEPAIYKVYAKLGKGREVTAVASSATLLDPTGWVEIDEGSGDKYKHAMSLYLPDIIVDGFCQYVWDGKKLVKRKDEREKEDTTTQERITSLKRMLGDTDYIVLKIAEGAETAEENAEILARRAWWRQEINRLEGTL